MYFLTDFTRGYMHVVKNFFIVWHTYFKCALRFVSVIFKDI